jgi:hypothetical protein
MHAEDKMSSSNIPIRREAESGGLSPWRSRAIWIRSNWPVKSPRGDTTAETDYLSQLLARGVVVECDSKRPQFFEVTVGDRWFYFHVFEEIRCVYLVSSKTVGL